MTEQLTRALHDATDDLESDLAPAAVWQRGRVRRRRTAAAAVGLAAASVVAVAVVSAGLASPDSTPTPTPAPTRTPESPYPTGPQDPQVDLGASHGVVAEDDLFPPTDPDDWPDLPAYPEDLGEWLSTETAVPLAEDPVTRAEAAIQSGLRGEASVVVIGEDGRRRQLDVSGLAFDGNAWEAYAGMGRDSLSPDGTRLAIGQRDGVVVVDLTTADSTFYTVDGLGPAWHGRTPYWSADGDAVLISQIYVNASPPDDLAYQDGWRVDLDDGAVSRVPYDPEHAALFEDGSLIANQWSERAGHSWERLDAGDEGSALDISTDLLGVLNQPTAQGDLWVARRELTLQSSDRAWDRDGFVALDQAGEVVSMLPVKGVYANGGGGRAIGWIDETVVVLAMPGPGGDPYRSIAWDVLSGELWRGPELLADSVVSLP